MMTQGQLPGSHNSIWVYLTQQYYCSWECTETQRFLPCRKIFKVKWLLCRLHSLLWHQPGPAWGKRGTSQSYRCYQSWGCSLQQGNSPSWRHEAPCCLAALFSPNNIVLKSHSPDWRVTATEQANIRVPADPPWLDPVTACSRRQKCSDPSTQ